MLSNAYIIMLYDTINGVVHQNLVYLSIAN